MDPYFTIPNPSVMCSTFLVSGDQPQCKGIKRRQVQPGGRERGLASTSLGRFPDRISLASGRCLRDI